MGLDVDLQAAEKAAVLLGKRRHTAQNVPSLPWQEVPAFYASLSDGTVTHLALRLLILTGVRSGPLRFLTKAQIDGDVWTTPGEDMKGRKGKTPAFRVPLSGEALSVLAQARRLARDGFMFPSVRKGVLSDATMSRLPGELIIATDRDDAGAGCQAGNALAEQASALGWAVSLWPAPKGQDWNDALRWGMVA